MKRSAPDEGSSWDGKTGVAGRSPQRRGEPRCCWVPSAYLVIPLRSPCSPRPSLSSLFSFSHVSPLLWAWNVGAYPGPHTSPIATRFISGYEISPTAIRMAMLSRGDCVCVLRQLIRFMQALLSRVKLALWDFPTCLSYPLGP